ncbi:uncharacterized protein MONOS_16893 [Monocercomonoides exilis]|uniref:uncharacterized protein n=1 Tax=Monocercomonoides exilis TaxID=2049356 RepID=UPI0035593D45|nr:hypothetical protein MONOS_16893 [Monocercomonoides exilis]
MNEVIEEMDEEGLESVVTAEVFNGIYTMIEEKKVTMKNILLLLKHVGCCKVLKRVFIDEFEVTSLNKRFEKMIIDENEKKKDEKNEKLLTDLCECYLLLNEEFPSELLSICVRCILKEALNKEENEKAQKEVEMALLALSKCFYFGKLDKELYLGEIKEIVQYHQEHHNLTRLAYQSAWKLLMSRFYFNKSLEDEIVNELHFVRETRRELEELSKCVDWKRKKVEREKETKEVIVLMKWLQLLEFFFRFCSFWNEEFVGLFGNVVQLFRASSGNHREIRGECIDFFRAAAENKIMKVEGLLKGRAIDVMMEEIQQPTLDDANAFRILRFFLIISERLKKKEIFETDEAKRKATKRKIFEKLEEEGCEDTFTSLYGEISFINDKCHDALSLTISEYFVII